jgi:hypothetical protein
MPIEVTLHTLDSCLIALAAFLQLFGIVLVVIARRQLSPSSHTTTILLSALPLQHARVLLHDACQEFDVCVVEAVVGVDLLLFW